MSNGTSNVAASNVSSVVQLDMDGNLIMVNEIATFAQSKSQAKEILGSVEKIGDRELLIGDSVNKRAIIVDALTSDIIWQYNSNHYVVDFHLNDQRTKEIIVYDGLISESLAYVRKGTTVTWKNESSIPISIHSGYTTYELFNMEPDLDLYGEKFSSDVLEPGDTFAFKFTDEAEYPWFVYPSIINGKIETLSQKLSAQDEYLILENDGQEMPFSSRLIRVDSWGNVIWSFGEGYLVKPRDARPMANNKVLIST